MTSYPLIGSLKKIRHLTIAHMETIRLQIHVLLNGMLLPRTTLEHLIQGPLATRELYCGSLPMSLKIRIYYNICEFSCVSSGISSKLAQSSYLGYGLCYRLLLFIQIHGQKLTLYMIDGGYYPNGFSVITLHAHTASRGYVELTGSHPQDVLNIQKLHFQPVNSTAIQKDLAALRSGVQVARYLATLPDFADHILEEKYPGPSVQTEEELNEYIFRRIFCRLNSRIVFTRSPSVSSPWMLHKQDGGRWWYESLVSYVPNSSVSR